MEETAGKEDPVELDSSPTLLTDMGGVAYGGASATLKHPNPHRWSTYFVRVNLHFGGVLALSGELVFAMISAEDIVRLGVWLGRHIC